MPMHVNRHNLSPCFALTVAFLSGGSAMVSGTAGMAQMSPPLARLATVDLANFSATMETAPVHISFVTATGTVLMVRMKMLFCVVGLYVCSVLIEASHYHMEHVFMFFMGLLSKSVY